MLKALKALLAPAAQAPHSKEFEQRQLKTAVAGLLFEMTRMDLEVKPEDLAAGRAALADLFGTPEPEARELLEHAAEQRNRLTSYFGPVSAINRWFPVEQRIRLVEHLWRIAYADGGLDPHEDHLVRKLSHLMYVPNTQCMLARGRARDAGT
jgi:uncharacterized tellurite resistance protein B-like protein